MYGEALQKNMTDLLAILPTNKEDTTTTRSTGGSIQLSQQSIEHTKSISLNDQTPHTQSQITPNDTPRHNTFSFSHPTTPIYFKQNDFRVSMSSVAAVMPRYRGSTVGGSSYTNTNVCVFVCSFFLGCFFVIFCVFVLFL